MCLCQCQIVIVHSNMEHNGHTTDESWPDCLVVVWYKGRCDHGMLGCADDEQVDKQQHTSN